ncbi:hypothetical protein BC829DRAFT_446445 [Chytridium lagenaria]|nr:hypothetical protein BC829DRAFT_446445 [Chytridium lagenaria]
MAFNSDRKVMSAEVASMMMAKEQASQSLGKALHSISESAFATVDGLRELSRHIYALARLYAMRNPTFRIFLLLAGILSILPVSVFAFFTVSTLLDRWSRLGSLIGLGLAVLLPIEAGILVVAGGVAMAYSSSRQMLNSIQAPETRKELTSLEEVEEENLALVKVSKVTEKAAAEAGI